MFAKHQISTLLHVSFNSNIPLIIPLKLIVYDRMIQWGVDLLSCMRLGLGIDLRTHGIWTDMPLLGDQTECALTYITQELSRIYDE